MVIAIAIPLGRIYQHNHYRIVVLLPDGSPASHASITLDYDPVSSYDPTRLTADHRGIVHIPPNRARGRGWETMRLAYAHGGKRYHASRRPSECQYPMAVTLNEQEAQVRSTEAETTAGIWGVIKKVFSLQG